MQTLSCHLDNTTVVAVTVPDHGDTPFTLFSYSPDKMRNLQLQDNTIGPVMRAKEQQDRLGSDIISAYCTQTRKLFQLGEQLQVSKGILFRIFYSPYHYDSTTNTQLVVLTSLHSEVLEYIHAGSGGGHLGQTKTLQKLKDRFYWPGHYNDVMRWCSTCPSCITRKSPTPKPKAPLLSVFVGCPMQLVAVDLLGPLPQSPAGNSYILVAAEYFIKWSEAYPLPNMKAVTVAAALTNEVFFRLGSPV